MDLGIDNGVDEPLLPTGQHRREDDDDGDTESGRQQQRQTGPNDNEEEDGSSTASPSTTTSPSRRRRLLLSVTPPRSRRTVAGGENDDGDSHSTTSSSRRRRTTLLTYTPPKTRGVLSRIYSSSSRLLPSSLSPSRTRTTTPTTTPPRQSEDTTGTVSSWIADPFESQQQQQESVSLYTSPFPPLGSPSDDDDDDDRTASADTVADLFAPPFPSAPPLVSAAAAEDDDQRSASAESVAELFAAVPPSSSPPPPVPFGVPPPSRRRTTVVGGDLEEEGTQFPEWYHPPVIIRHRTSVVAADTTSQPRRDSASNNSPLAGTSMSGGAEKNESDSHAGGSNPAADDIAAAARGGGGRRSPSSATNGGSSSGDLEMSPDEGVKASPPTTSRKTSARYRDDPSGRYTDIHHHHPPTSHHHHHMTNIRGDGYGGGGSMHESYGGTAPPAHIPYEKIETKHTSIHDTIQSHNYEPDESEVWRAYVAQQHFRNRGQWWTTGKKRALKRWSFTFLIGLIQGFVACFCNMATKYLSRLKFEQVYDLLQAGTTFKDASAVGGAGGESGVGDDLFTGDSYDGDGTNDPNGNDDESNTMLGSGSFSFGGSAFLAYLFYQTLFAALASLFVYVEPVSGGSGIPEIKCFLNGIDLPRVVRVRTLICKVVGVTFSVAAGLPVGKEGPMVHSGSVVAAGVSQGRTKFWGVDTSFSKFSDFRNDREKRDFVACGAAAGVTSAFGAPIGGVLFSLEEGASYWSTKLTWRAFFCAMITLGTLFGVRNFDSWWGQANIEKLFSFGEFNSLSGESSNFSIWELFLFMIIGCLGGLIGAVFNAANEHLTIWRMKKINYSKARRFVEVIVVSIGVTTISFLMPLIWNRCTELPTDMQDWSNQEKNLVEALVPFRCEAGKEYNEVASLIFTDADTAIKQLFHFREAGQDDSSTFSSAALFLFFLPYISMATVVYGIAIPSGLFVPSLLSGAAFGRLCGHLLHKLDHTSGTFADSGTYALMGAAAVLGGMARMTISLTVILLEATGDMQYVLPLMLTLMAARFTGNVFNEGLYDIHIKLKNIPFLEAEVPTIAERHEIVAGQVMSTEVKCLRPVERAGVVYDLLRSCSHGTFPIVDTATGGTLYGTAGRSMLCTLLQRRAFGQPDALSDYDDTQNGGVGAGALGPRRLSPLVQWDTIERVYPRYPKIDEIEMRQSDRNCWLDLRPYANTAPYTVNETASIQRTYRLFRTLGLRFLCVVNHNNQVVGIITRKDLLPESLSDSLMRGRNAHMNVVNNFT